MQPMRVFYILVRVQYSLYYVHYPFCLPSKRSMSIYIVNVRELDATKCMGKLTESKSTSRQSMTHKGVHTIPAA